MFASRTATGKALAAYSSLASAVGIGASCAWLRHCYFEDFSHDNDALFQSPFLKKLNPNSNPMITDSCVRDVPISKIQPDLVEDALCGGSELLERFCGGIWGGYGYAIQRRILKTFCLNPNNAITDLWDKEELLNSEYDADIGITDHLLVLEKDTKSVLIRGCRSPRNHPDGPSEMENLSEICVEILSEKKLARFRMKNLFFLGEAEDSKPPFPAPIIWLHYLYCKTLVESGVSHCLL